MSEQELISTNNDIELGIIQTNTEIIKTQSIMDIINEKRNDQDFQQRINVATTLVLEIYRVLMGAFLILFVPQKCGEDICSIIDNIERNDMLSRCGIYVNSITVIAFFFLYFVEVKRENKLINYLEVNRFTPVDNNSVGNALLKLAPEKKQTILYYDEYYRTSGYISTATFIINAIISSIVVYSNYLDSKTVSVYLTNLLFMGLKVTDVYSTVNTKTNVFYSAYLKNKIQFNDVDPDKIISHDDDDKIEDDDKIQHDVNIQHDDKIEDV